MCQFHETSLHETARPLAQLDLKHANGKPVLRPHEIRKKSVYAKGTIFFCVDDALDWKVAIGMLFDGAIWINLDLKWIQAFQASEKARLSLWIDPWKRTMFIGDTPVALR